MKPKYYQKCSFPEALSGYSPNTNLFNVRVSRLFIFLKVNHFSINIECLILQVHLLRIFCPVLDEVQNIMWYFSLNTTLVKNNTFKELPDQRGHRAKDAHQSNYWDNTLQWHILRISRKSINCINHSINRVNLLQFGEVKIKFSYCINFLYLIWVPRLASHHPNLWREWDLPL